MKNTIEHGSLVSAICSNNLRSVSYTLLNNKNLDLLYKEGKLFDFTISKDNPDTLKLLLNYFEDVQYPDHGSKEYEDARDELCKILEKAIEDIKLTREMKDVLYPYVEDMSESSDSIKEQFGENHEQDPIDEIDPNDSEAFVKVKNIAKELEVDDSTKESELKWKQTDELLKTSSEHKPELHESKEHRWFSLSTKDSTPEKEIDDTSVSGDCVELGQS